MKIQLNEHQIKFLFNEALALDTAKEYAKIQRSPEITQKINRIFEIIKQKYPDFKTSKRGDRLYVPFGSQLKDEIIGAVESNEFDVKDYDNGILVNRRNGQETKLGKVLTRIKREDLLTKYNTDKSKGAVTNPSGYMVFSKHQYDIAGMSTNRDWTSCMNLDTGSNRRYVSCDITEGSFVVYLVDANDLNITKPKGRLAIKPFINQQDHSDIIFFPESRTYGSVPSEFKDDVEELFNDINSDTQGVLYQKNEKLYNDSNTTNYTNLKKIRTPQDVENIVHNLDDRTTKELAMQSDMILDYVMKSPRINHYVKESIIDVSKYEDVKQYLTVNFLNGYMSSGGLDNLIDRWPQVKETIMTAPRVFEKKFISVLLKYDPNYISKVSDKTIQKLGDSQFFDILHYQHKFFPEFYDKFKDKMAQSGQRLVYFLEEHPEYIVKSYPIFKKIFREMTEYNRERFISITMQHYPQIFNFYLYNEKPMLDQYFKDQTNRNESVFRNNKLLYLVHAHYPSFVDELVFHEIKMLVNRNPSLIPFLSKYYMSVFNDFFDAYDVYRFLYYAPDYISTFMKSAPDIVKKLDRHDIERLMTVHPDYAVLFQKFFNY